MIIHRSDCENIRSMGADMERAIHVDWKPTEEISFVASIRVHALNRKNLLIDITGAIAKSNCNIRSAYITTSEDTAVCDFDVDVKDLASLNFLMKDIRNIKSVNKVIRQDMRSPQDIPFHNTGAGPG